MEYEEVYQGAFYGTLRSEIDRLWDEGKHVLFDIDVVGGLNVKAQYPPKHPLHFCTTSFPRRTGKSST